MKKLSVVNVFVYTASRMLNTNISVILLIACLICAGLPISIMAADNIVLKAATYHPVKHRLTEDAFKLWGTELEKRTEGKVKIKWYLGATLVKATQSYSALNSGLIDMSIPGILWLFPDRFPITMGIQLPFLIDSESHASRTMALMYQTIPELKKEFNDNDVVPIGWGVTGINHYHFKEKPLKSLSDFSGRKIITPFASIASALKGLGATPVVLKLPELYTGMQRGMADGVAFPFAPLRSFKLVDFVKYHTVANDNIGPNIHIMSKKTWDKLPKDVQSVITDLRRPLGCLTAKTLENEANWVLEGLKNRGDDIYYPTSEQRKEFVVKLKFMYDAYVESLNKKGLDGQAILDKVMQAAADAKKDPCKREAWWGRAGKK